MMGSGSEFRRGQNSPNPDSVKVTLNFDREPNYGELVFFWSEFLVYGELQALLRSGVGCSTMLINDASTEGSRARCLVAMAHIKELPDPKSSDR